MNHIVKLVFIFLFSVNSIFGRSTNIDSLLSILPTVNDTTKINTLLEISKYHHRHGNIPLAKDFCEQAIGLSKNEPNVFFLATALLWMGSIYNGTGDFSIALEYLLKSYHLLEKTSNKKLVFSVSNALGNNYQAQNNFEKALEFYNITFEVASGLKDTYGSNKALIGIGNVYYGQKDYKKALDAYLRAANGFDKIKNKYEYALALANLGNLYMVMNENEKAIKLLEETYQIMIELDDRYGIGQTLLTIGNVYKQKRNYEMSLVYYYNSMNVFKTSAARYDLKTVYQEIAGAYNKQNKNDSAFHYIQLYASTKDSIFSEENSKLIAEMQTKYESVKKEEENKSLLFQNELAENKIKQQNRAQIALLLFLGMAFIFSVFLFRSNKQKQKKNKIISLQKENAEEQRRQLQFKNKEMVDSITYAKRLQEAILPPIILIRKYLPESFVLYKPKDIVAGDFYWMEVINDESINSQQILVAAADCTGHGVPGAIVSVVCSNALNRTVKEFGITDPGKILDKVRELVVETFVGNSSAGEKNDVKDGMDISLINIEFGGGTEEKISIKWAGANNPLWIIKDHSGQDEKLTEIKANKQSIGKTDAPTQFTTHSIELNKNDQFYLFTDGYADQFGGEKEKKFKNLPLKELLITNSHLSMQEQKDILDNTIEKWKGNLEQVDDILIIGIRV